LIGVIKKMMIGKIPPTDSQAEGVTAEYTEELKKELTEAKATVQTNLAGWQRAQADFINYKRSSDQEREEIKNFSNSLIPVLDGLELAFTHVPNEIAEGGWLEGVRLIERKLKATLQAQGLTEIKALGEVFDPYIHEAIMSISGEEGVVVQEFQKGYKFRDQIIRPSKVSVGSSK
jgi:molecular chaperone GrpE